MDKFGKLYIVATPIGNLEDITLRAITVLKEVQLIAAEDTRQSKKLLNHYGINSPLYSLHAHNERTHSAKILEALSQGHNVAYITDAGTPLISDPGAYLVHLVRSQGFDIIPIPGPSAAITALSVSGFSKPNFYFGGFLPSKASLRISQLNKLKNFPCALVFYESPHRILQSLDDMLNILGDKEAILARELTKKYETIYAGKISQLIQSLTKSPEQVRGEFVVLLAESEIEQANTQEQTEFVLKTLMEKLSVKQSVEIASKLLNMPKNELYDLSLELKKRFNL